MIGNVVKTTLVAQDQASRVIQGLQNNVKDGAKGFNLLGAAGGAAMAGIVVGTGAAIAGAVGLTRAFSEANTIAMSALKASNNLSAELGNVSLEMAEGYVESLNKKLTQAAAALPGTTKEYVALSNVISNDVARAFPNADGSLNVAGWEKATTDIVSLLKFVGGEADQAKVLLGSQKLLAGNATLNEIRQYDFFGSNVAFMRGLEKAQQDLGKEWKEFTQEERVKTLSGLKNVLLSDEMIDRMSKSVTGLVELFNTKYFDPTTGLFGIMRELDKNGGSVYKSLTETVGLFIGKNGIVTSMLDSLAGLNFDPMVALKGRIDQFNAFLTKITNYLEVFKDTEGVVDIGRLTLDIKDNFGLFFGSIRDRIAGFGTGSGNLVNTITSGLNNLDWNKIGASLGTLLANAIDVTLKALGNFVATVDYGSLIGLLKNIGVGILSGIGAFFNNLDASTYLAGATALIGGALVSFLMTGFIPGLATLLIVGLGTITAGIASVLSAPVLLAIAGVGLVVVATMKHFGISFQEVFSFVFATIKGMAGPIIGAAQMGFNNLRTVIMAIVDGVTALFNGAKGLLDRIPGVNLGSTPNVGNAASGFLPDAFKREMQQMPSGANPIIANSSELILNRDQQRSLLAGRGSSTISLGGINIYATQGQNPSEIADQVMRQVENKLARRYAV